jgi:hypothetical protein
MALAYHLAAVVITETLGAGANWPSAPSRPGSKTQPGASPRP